MKPESVGVSRPELVDEPALIAAIDAGRLSGAALDVFETRNGISPDLLQLARDPASSSCAHGLGHARSAHRDGRDGDRQHPRLRRRTPAAAPPMPDPASGLVGHLPQPLFKIAPLRRLLGQCQRRGTHHAPPTIAPPAAEIGLGGMGETIGGEGAGDQRPNQVEPHFRTIAHRNSDPRD